MASMHVRAVTLALALVLPVVPLLAAAAQDDDAAEEIEARIEQARKQLDEAARKLADLHSEMWKLETTGPRADRPMLGILLQDSGTAAGLTLGGVTPEGGAEQAGLKAGDTIVEVNGVRLDVSGESKPVSALAEAMAPVQAGEAVAVTYVRDGRTGTASVVTQPRGPYMARVVEEKAPWLESLRSLGELEDLEALEGLEDLEVLEELELGEDVVKAPAGLSLLDVDGDLAGYFEVQQGIVVLEVPARATALKAGDVLLAIDGEAVTDQSAALQRLAAVNGKVPVRVKRRGSEREVDVDADALNAEQSLHVFRGDRHIRLQRDSDGKMALVEIVIRRD